MEQKKPMIAIVGHGRAHGALGAMLALMDAVPMYPCDPMPKVKLSRSSTVLACSSCGKRNVTLKKVGDNEYKCLKCSKEADHEG